MNFLLVQQTAIDEGAETGRDVTPPSHSGGSLGRLESATANEERRSRELSLGVPTGWRADG